VRAHLGADVFGSVRAKTGSEAAAEDDAIDVKEVDDRGTGSGNGVVRVVDEFVRETVVLSQRSFPHTTCEAIPVRLAHEVEQLRALSAFVELARASLHRRSPRVRLGASTAAARTNTSTELHDGVPELAGGPIAFPSLASEHDRPAEAGSPPDGQERLEVAAGAEFEFGGGGCCDVVCHPHTGPDPPNQFLGKGVRIGPTARQIRVESDRAGGSVDSAG
jgi:hypothetical protein